MLRISGGRSRKGDFFELRLVLFGRGVRMGWDEGVFTYMAMHWPRGLGLRSPSRCLRTRNGTAVLGFVFSIPVMKVGMLGSGWRSVGGRVGDIAKTVVVKLVALE